MQALQHNTRHLQRLAWALGNAATEERKGLPGELRAGRCTRIEIAAQRSECASTQGEVLFDELSSADREEKQRRKNDRLPHAHSEKMHCAG